MLLADLHLPAFIDAHLEWYVAAALIVAGLAASGLADLSRFSPTRIWAISGVCFQESIRRRVLWIIPLTIVGVVVAVQLLNPIDEQDAVRQTIKYALFATGTLVVLVTIILACTNLPKEIDNRVIYTIVTKPTTRLEIIVGKIVGFARVSATLLLIMGVFTYGYAHLRAGHLQSKARSRLETMSPTDSGRLSLQHYADYGLLQSKTYARTADFQQFARLPLPEETNRWVNGDDEQSFVIGFDLPPALFPDPGTGQDNGGLQIVGQIATEYFDPNREWHPTPFPGTMPGAAEFKGFSLKEISRPAVTIEIQGPDKYNLIPSTEMPGGGFVELTGSKKSEDQQLLTLTAVSLDRVYQLPENRRRINVKFQGNGPIRYGVSRGAVHLFSPRLKSLGQSGIIVSVKDADGQPAWPTFRGRELVGNQEFKGVADPAKGSVGVFAFRNVAVPSNDAPVPVELRCGIEGSGEEISSGESNTHAIVEVYNLTTGQTSPSLDLPIESNRTVFFNIPAEAVTGGNFDVRLRCQAPGRYLVLRNALASNPALQLVIGQESFAINLSKSLLIMWCMSLLVVIVSIFCSTFVSWPIAVVLSVVILLGHWGAQQIGDTNATGMGAQVAKDMFGVKNPAEAKVISSAVDSLSRTLNIASKVLPDISQFSATEDIERGITIAPHVLLASIKVILAFGLPLTILAYAFLKRKEVAP